MQEEKINKPKEEHLKNLCPSVWSEEEKELRKILEKAVSKSVCIPEIASKVNQLRQARINQAIEQLQANRLKWMKKKCKECKGKSD